jgi:mannose-6-phosphate isomerase
MWHILDAEPGATIALGFRRPVTRERLRDAARSGEIEELLNWMPVKAGETYFTPAHTVHAIGGGIVLCEIQQNSDITYRLWDYGRPRELHLGQAVRVADLGVHPGAVPDGGEELVRCPYFVTSAVRMAPGDEQTPSPRRCQLWVCLEGAGSIGGEPFRTGEVWLLPETGPPPSIRAAGPTRFLRTYVPEQGEEVGAGAGTRPT